MITQDWPDIAHTAGAAGLKALRKIWYTKEPLTPVEDRLLRNLFQQYPLGQDNYHKWLKQIVRQVAEQFIREREGKNASNSI